MEIPNELRSTLEVVDEGNCKHIKCRYRVKKGSECGALFVSLEDAIRHLIIHDERYKKYFNVYVQENKK